MNCRIPQIFLVAAIALTAVTSWAEMRPAWVLERADFQESIVSTNLSEREQLVKDGWTIDGAGTMRTAWEAGAGPLHRLSRPGETGTDRLLETDIAQLPTLKQAGYRDEGVVGFVADSDGAERVAVVQFSKGNRKLWVVSNGAQAKLEKEGWKRQGIHFWLWPATAK